MKQSGLSACTLFFLLTYALPDYAISYFSYRSQGTDAAREMVGVEEFINLLGMHTWYGMASIAQQYAQTFDSNKLAQGLFGNDVTGSRYCPATLTISGSRAAARGANDWLADYFGLPTDFVSAITFVPSIKNLIIDFNLYVGLDKVAPGLFVRLNMPFAATRWTLDARETIIDPGSNGYDFGYFSPNFIFRGQLLNNALTFLSGADALYLLVPENYTAPGGIPSNAAYANIGSPGVTTYLSDVVFNPLACSKWAGNNTCYKQGLDKAGLADVEMILGYNVLLKKRGFLGCNLRAVAPTGNRPRGEFFFEPIIGNGGHWEVGAGISACIHLWSSLRKRSSLDLYADANITHLCKAVQKRSFDLLAHGLNSRYMLAQKMIASTNQLGGTSEYNDTDSADVLVADFQFNNEFTPVANLTWSKVNVGVAVQADIAIKLALLVTNGFGLDVGYNAWVRSHEKICPLSACCINDQACGTAWALKGDAMVFGHRHAEKKAIALSATENSATVHGGTNDIVPDTTSYEEFFLQSTGINDSGVNNYGVDNAFFAVEIEGGTPEVVYGFHNFIKTSVQPILLNDSALDMRGMGSTSHKLFAHFSYSWVESVAPYLPFLGVGFSVELGVNKLSNFNFSDNLFSTGASSVGCQSLALAKNFSSSVSQVSLWIKGGVAF